jgi:hypothetical protein
MMQTALLTGALLLPHLCAAQGQTGSTLDGPSLGLMFDSSSAVIRPILGIPGAATLGAPLNAGFAVGQAVVAPGADFALVVAKDDFSLAVVRGSGEVLQNFTPAMGEAPDLISFSPGGSSAALYYRASGRLLVLAGLRSEAPQSAEADASSLPAAPSLVAVSENAASLLLAVRAGETTGLYLLPNRTPKATPANPKLLAAAGLRNDPPEVPSRAHAVVQKVGTFQSVSALRFAGGSSDALVSDGAANAAYIIQNASGATQITALGSAQDGLSRPIAIEAMDTRRVLVANAGSNTLTILYRDGTPAATIQCGCSPVVLHQLSGSAVYRLTEPSQEPMWLLDAGSNELRIVAVPPDRSQNAPAVAAEGAQR